ncbi:glycosyltransferase [Synechococcus sp. CS-1327]|uniref:glycosyltransferase n=1 Tax=Synechococcus sp. CS-1327 TaxID=2847977 RepID=UPI00223C384C|nr:glycosyltransferase [Synechococcus sp. CS-1327]MCT0233010.1 glycosyltransferase [Synechococcus sp. CS-1327]
MLRKIVVITGPYVIPSIYYGGIQRIVHLLCSGLSEQGIEVDLLAGTGSSTYSGRTYTYRHQKPTLQSRLYRRLAFQATAIRAALDRADLIHSFVMWPEYHGLLHALNLPILFTQQNTAAADDWERIVKVNQSRSFYIGISQDQISSVQGLPPERSTVIGNATDFNLIRPVADPSGAYLAFLGRLSHDKGVDLAIRLSLATGIPLKIAGIIPHEEKGADQFFHEHVAPYLGRSGIEYIGEIDDGAKSTFLGNALALLMPNRWREPFGIVMVEALAAGTPVIGSNLGSIPELVEHGQTGFICDSFEAFVEAIRRVHQLDRTICRTSGERRFSKSVFIQAHLDFYASALAMLSPRRGL